MDHLEYKDVVNKAFKTYYDKFKKMVKKDLDGDGWFLLVKDFPFKDGENLMFSAGEDIGKWPKKNLISLYGKTNFIVGRARKKGPVITLLDFQEGDYIKKATESGLRKELKQYFQGTGVSVRIFKSVKVSESEPEVETEEEDSVASGPSETTTSQQDTGQEPVIPELYTPTEQRAFIMKMGTEIPKRALAAGLSEESEYKKQWINLNRLVRNGNTDGSMEAVEGMLIYLRENEGENEATSENIDASKHLQLEEELASLKVTETNLRQQLQKHIKELATVLKQGPSRQLERQFTLIGKSEKMLSDLVDTHAIRRNEIESELASLV